MAFMSWCVFGAYWMHLEWRIQQDSSGFSGQTVEILLSALQGMDACLARNENSQRLYDAELYPATVQRRREVKKQGNRIAEASLNINIMDSAALEALPRIGPKVAGRICRFRAALGGFHSVQQLREVWGMHPDQVEAIIPWFHKGEGVFRFLCLNQASWKEFQSHPYIRYAGANAVTAYRDLHHLKQVEDLKSAIPVNDSLFRRWSPYLRVCKIRSDAVASSPSKRD
jgi:DNA uptake protein ComE-like DNA-binding protein